MKYIVHFLLLLNWYHITAVSTDDLVNNDENEVPLTRVRRGGLSMLRLGRGLQMLRLGKRGMPLMTRLGRSLDELTSDELKYLLFSLYGDKTEGAFRRQVPLPRYGREDSDLQMLVENLLSRDRGQGYIYDRDDQSPRSIRIAPRPGRFRRSVDSQEDDKEDIQEQKSAEIKSLPLPRFGRLILGAERALPLPRLGRQELYDYMYTLDPSQDKETGTEKRAMHMLRLGRAMNMLRLGKRPMGMLRLAHVNGPINEGSDKRSLSMLRLGKRLHMLRLGKRSKDEKNELSSGADSDSSHEIDTRGMNMLRLGRNIQ